MTTFTPELTEALDKLEEVFGPTPVDLDYLRPTYDYGEYAKSQLRYVLSNWANYKVVQSTDWKEIQRQREEAAAAKLAERSESIRDGIVLGALSGLITKAYKALPDVWVSFDVDEESGCLLIWNHVEQTRVAKLTYDKAENKVFTDLKVKGLNFEDDVTVISGNTSPRRQIEGLDAIHTFLTEQENKA